MALTEKLGNIGDAIRSKTGGTDLLTLDEMPGAIAGIEGGGGECDKPHIPDEALVISGDCSNRFYKGNWNWFVEEFADRITTRNINCAQSMFQYSGIAEIPFDFNCGSNSYNAFSYMFAACSNLKSIGKISGMHPSDMSCMFQNCYMLRYLPEFENLNMDRIHSYQYSNISGIFYGCRSLRSIPEDLLKEIYNASTTYSFYGVCASGFNCCYVLDEIKGLNPQTNTITSNMFSDTFSGCCRVKDIIFATKEDGTPYECNWKSQTITLSVRTGYASMEESITGNNSGITEATRVTDDASYQALKNDPDWWTTKAEYSRYNHDSAVNTINSLPDTSAYLASAGGTNTIEFKGEAGSATDGGAINTLTSEEIAVATAKGWTVTLV